MTTEISRIVMDNNDKIIIYEISKVVKKCGSGGHVFVPGELVGKKIRLIFNETEIKK